MPKGKGWRGIETVLGSFDGLKRFVSIAESPYHGLNFCQGTVSEMLERPGEQSLRRHPLLRLAQEDLQRALP
jgi:mannonate dehydratase